LILKSIIRRLVITNFSSTNSPAHCICKRKLIYKLYHTAGIPWGSCWIKYQKTNALSRKKFRNIVEQSSMGCQCRRWTNPYLLT
jgi:hypothetical protein